MQAKEWRDWEEAWKPNQAAAARRVDTDRVAVGVDDGEAQLCRDVAPLDQFAVGSRSPQESGRLHVPRQVKMGRWLGLPRRRSIRTGRDVAAGRGGRRDGGR